MMLNVLFYVGAGIFANDNPVSNNSVVLADRNNEIGTIYCSSGSRSSGIGQWYAPNGVAITESSTLFSVVRGGGDFPAFVGLQLRANQSLTQFFEGVYTCIIPDENGISRSLHIGIFRYGFRGMYVGYITETKESKTPRSLNNLVPVWSRCLDPSYYTSKAELLLGEQRASEPR